MYQKQAVWSFRKDTGGQKLPALPLVLLEPVLLLHVRVFRAVDFAVEHVDGARAHFALAVERAVHHEVLVRLGVMRDADYLVQVVVRSIRRASSR